MCFSFWSGPNSRIFRKSMPSGSDLQRIGTCLDTGDPKGPWVLASRRKRRSYLGKRISERPYMGQTAGQIIKLSKYVETGFLCRIIGHRCHKSYDRCSVHAYAFACYGKWRVPKSRRTPIEWNHRRGLHSSTKHCTCSCRE